MGIGVSGRSAEERDHGVENAVVHLEVHPGPLAVGIYFEEHRIVQVVCFDEEIKSPEAEPQRTHVSLDLGC